MSSSIDALITSSSLPHQYVAIATPQQFVAHKVGRVGYF